MTTPPPMMQPQDPHADAVVLQHGDAVACIDTLGSTLRSCSVAGRDLVLATPVGSLAPGMHGCILAPWPNRLQDGRFTFRGARHSVTVNEPDRHNANHGLVWNRRWTITERGPRHVVMHLDLGAQAYGYPLAIDATHTLDADGLRIAVRAHNVGSHPAPWGIGFHPWLSPGGASIDDCTLGFPASRWLECDERLLPVAWRPVPELLDFNRARTVGDSRLDDGFLAGPSAVASLTAPDGHAVEVHAEHGLPCWQVCTGDFDDLGPLRRAGVAVEPMSCPANALVSGDHLRVIEPGDADGVRWRLRLRST